MENVIAYIDGYNLYHSLKEAKMNKFLWLNIPLLMSTYLTENQQLKKTYYFTSPSILPQSNRRQIVYNEALEAESTKNFSRLKIKQGHFLKDSVICPGCQEVSQCANCGQVLSFYHEKETDVNIAIQMLVDAFSDEFDVAFLLTADSDQVGTIKAIKELDPHKRIVIIIPPGRNPKELKNYP